MCSGWIFNIIHVSLLKVIDCIIFRLIPSLVATDSDSEGGLTWLQVEEVFKHTQTVVDTMLLELRFVCYS